MANFRSIAPFFLKSTFIIILTSYSWFICRFMRSTVIRYPNDMLSAVFCGTVVSFYMFIISILILLAQSKKVSNWIINLLLWTHFLILFPLMYGSKVLLCEQEVDALEDFIKLAVIAICAIFTTLKIMDVVKPKIPTELIFKRSNDLGRIFVMEEDIHSYVEGLITFWVGLSIIDTLNGNEWILSILQLTACLIFLIIFFCNLRIVAEFRKVVFSLCGRAIMSWGVNASAWMLAVYLMQWFYGDGVLPMEVMLFIVNVHGFCSLFMLFTIFVLRKDVFFMELSTELEIVKEDNQLSINLVVEK